MTGVAKIQLRGPYICSEHCYYVHMGPHHIISMHMVFPHRSKDVRLKHVKLYLGKRVVRGLQYLQQVKLFLTSCTDIKLREGTRSCEAGVKAHVHWHGAK